MSWTEPSGPRTILFTGGLERLRARRHRCLLALHPQRTLQNVCRFSWLEATAVFGALRAEGPRLRGMAVARWRGLQRDQIQMMVLIRRTLPLRVMCVLECMHLLARCFKFQLLSFFSSSSLLTDQALHSETNVQR